jgi:hypothetical protein
MNIAWAFNPDWSDIEAEVWWRLRGLGPDTPTGEKLKALTPPSVILSKLSHLEEAAILEELREYLKLRAADLAGLKADVRKVRKERESKAKKDNSTSPTLDDLADVHRLHPAIDFSPDFMNIGFRVDLPENDTGLVILISDGQGVRDEVNPDTLEIGGRVYQIIRNTAPTLLQDVWKLERLKAFLEHPTNPQGLYQALKDACREYPDLPEPAYGLLSAWSVGTYLAHLFTAIPFLHFHGPKEYGKSKTLEAMRWVCLNAWKGRDISAAALGDTMEGQEAQCSLTRLRIYPQNWWAFWQIHIRRLVVSAE